MAKGGFLPPYPLDLKNERRNKKRETKEEEEEEEEATTIMRRRSRKLGQWAIRRSQTKRTTRCMSYSRRLQPGIVFPNYAWLCPDCHGVPPREFVHFDLGPTSAEEIEFIHSVSPTTSLTVSA